MNRKFGYRHGHDDTDYMKSAGDNAERLVAAVKAALPNHDPFVSPWLHLDWQGQQGACQGFALENCAETMFNQHTGFLVAFSMAQAYYESQRKDRISGDRGSTLSAGMKVAKDGLVLEELWPYPERYNNRRPSGFDTMPRVRFFASEPATDADLIWDAIKAGCAVQDGIGWNGYCDQLWASQYRSRGRAGGHSTMYYGMVMKDGQEWAIRNNSWRGWGDQGRSYVSKQFIKDNLRYDPYPVYTIWRPDQVEIDPGIWDLIDPDKLRTNAA